MKKVKVSSQFEIKSNIINTLCDYTESAFTVLMDEMLGFTDGVVSGLTQTKDSSPSGNLQNVYVAPGKIYIGGVYGELEAEETITVTIPVSGSKTDVITAGYEEVEDTTISSYRLVDVETREVETATTDTRRLGSVVLTLNTDTVASACTGVVIATISSTSAGIQTLTDERTISKMDNLTVGETSISGDFSVNTDKFTVAASSGNTVIAGTLDVTGATELASSLTVGGVLSSTNNFGVAGKFSVLAASGNTSITGTLDVTGATTVGVITATGLATFNGGITFPTVADSGTVASLILDRYMEGSFAIASSEVTIPQNTTAYYTRIGDVVFLKIGFYGTLPLPVGITITGIPAGLRPAENQIFAQILQDNGTSALGSATITTTGTVLLALDAGTGEFSSGSCGFILFTVISYRLD